MREIKFRGKRVDNGVYTHCSITLILWAKMNGCSAL